MLHAVQYFLSLSAHYYNFQCDCNNLKKKPWQPYISQLQSVQATNWKGKNQKKNQDIKQKKKKKTLQYR